MKNGIILWSQSGNLDSPDVLSQNGERILPGDQRWSRLSSMLFVGHGDINLIKGEDLSIQLIGTSLLVKGTLSQVDSLNRSRVFSALVPFGQDALLSKLRDELALYDLSFSSSCERGLLMFAQRMKRMKKILIGFLLFLLVIYIIVVLK